MAVIDTGSDELEVLLVLKMPFSVLSMTYPVIDNITSIDESKPEDWISELSNQLIRRVKTKLIEHNFFIKPYELAPGTHDFAFLTNDFEFAQTRNRAYRQNTNHELLLLLK